MENALIKEEDGLVPMPTCSNCQSAMVEGEVFCSQCGFPENGNEEDRANFARRVGAKKKLLNEVKREVRRGKNTLIVLGVLNILIGLFYIFFLEEIAAAVIQMILALVYLGLSIWTDKQPFGALLSALILYITLILLMAVLDPATIVQGVVLKVIIIGFLVRGVKSGHEAKNIYRELEDLGVKPR